MTILEGEIVPVLAEMDVKDQQVIDEAMISAGWDGGQRKVRGQYYDCYLYGGGEGQGHLYGSTLIPLSVGPADPFCMPVPMMNVLNGGVHANWLGLTFRNI